MTTTIDRPNEGGTAALVPTPGKAAGKLYDFDITLIQLDPATQPRAELNQETVEQYAEHMRDGAELPPVILFDDGHRYWLPDGPHPGPGGRSLGRTHIRAEVRQGSREDAILFGLSANATLPRTNEDKRRAVTVALRLPKLAGKSDREIAAACAVSHTFVAGVRRELTGNGYQMPERR